MSLEKYRNKRRFQETPEAVGGVGNGKLSFKLKGQRLCGKFDLVRSGQAQDS